MKKIIFSLIALFSISVFGGYAKESEKVSKVANAIETMHDDTKDAVTTIYSDGKGLITTLYGDGKELLSNVYPDVKNAIIEIGKAVGVAAEHVYSVLVKKYVVDGVQQLLLFLVGIALLIIGWVKVERYNKAHEKIEWRVLFPLCFLASGVIVLFSVNYSTMFMGLINPEWGAINYILEFTKSAIH